MPCYRTQTHTGTWDGCKGVSLKMWKMKMIICNIFYKTPHGYIWSERSEVGCRWEIKKFLPDFWNVRQGDNVDVVCDIVTGCRLCVTQSVHVTHLISLLTNWSRISWHQTKFLLYIWPEITTTTAPEVSCSRLNESLHRQWRETERDSHVACVRCDTWHQCIDQHYHCQLSPPPDILPSVSHPSSPRKQWY